MSCSSLLGFNYACGSYLWMYDVWLCRKHSAKHLYEEEKALESESTLLLTEQRREVRSKGPRLILSNTNRAAHSRVHTIGTSSDTSGFHLTFLPISSCHLSFLLIPADAHLWFVPCKVPVDRPTSCRGSPVVMSRVCGYDTRDQIPYFLDYKLLS